MRIKERGNKQNKSQKKRWGRGLGFWSKATATLTFDFSFCLIIPLCRLLLRVLPPNPSSPPPQSPLTAIHFSPFYLFSFSLGGVGLYRVGRSRSRSVGGPGGCRSSSFWKAFSFKFYFAGILFLPTPPWTCPWCIGPRVWQLTPASFHPSFLLLPKQIFFKFASSKRKHG